MGRKRRYRRRPMPLVEFNAERTEIFDDFFDRTRHLALVVGVLNTKIEHAVLCGGMRDAFVGKTAVEVADVHGTGGAGRDTRYFCALAQTAFGKALFEGFDRVGVGDVRKNKGGKLLKIIGVRHIVLILSEFGECYFIKIQ